MAYDLMRGAQDGRDWSLGAAFVGDDPDSEIPFLIAASDANRIVGKAVDEEQQAVEEIFRASSEGKIDEPTMRSFKRYHDEFHRWLKSTGSRPYGRMKFGLAGIYKTAYEHRKQIRDWRDLAARAGATPVGPRARDVDRKKDDGGGGGGAWKWLAILGAGGLGAMFLSRKIGEPRG